MPAYLWEPMEDQKIHCQLCHHHCQIKNGRRGICGVRENRAGTLESLAYGKLVAANPDPIEKKPLFHVLPGSRSYSIATVGCNFRCHFCQNADIAQMPNDRNGLILGEVSTPQQVVARAKRDGCKSIAYTYTEPTVYFETAYDIAKLAHAQGLLNVFVTNGYMTPKALDMLQPYLDAANVDLKAFCNESYKRCCGGQLEPVKDTLVKMKTMGIWVEVTTLIIPEFNDDLNELRAMADFIVNKLGSNTPWHLSRFHPTYKMTDRCATPVDTILNARKIGLEAGLKYVYIGNIVGYGGEDTFCPQCGQIVVDRKGFYVSRNHTTNGKCPQCDMIIEGIGI
ncbi:MAG: AmmeMemoRadiSam system radical SAM enzyme [Desulfobacteraceae bacterium]|jgi:pyruvate formate lyase activating enzyme